MQKCRNPEILRNYINRYVKIIEKLSKETTFDAINEMLEDGLDDKRHLVQLKEILFQFYTIS